MNLNEYKGRSVSEALLSSSHSFICDTEKLEMFTFLQLAMHRVLRLKFLESSDPWKKSSIFLVSWDLRFKGILIAKPQTIKLHTVRALKRYLNEKNLIHGRVTATILEFSA